MVEKSIKKNNGALGNIFKRIYTKDFSGYTGLAIKNSIYSFGTTFLNRAGGMILTIILARVLLPELFGLYSLALSTILLFATFSDLGVGPTLVRFLSKTLGRGDNKKAEGYLIYLLKIKMIIIFMTLSLLLLLSRYLAQDYFKKPLFLALVAGAVYILFVGLAGFSYLIFQASNNFKFLFKNEVFAQFIRLVFIPLIVLFLIKNGVANHFIIFWAILLLGLSWALVILFLFLFGDKKSLLLKKGIIKLTGKEKKEVLSFLIGASALGFSGLFFGYIDMLLLGHFLGSVFIGYYRAAANIVGSLIALMTFSAVLLPIFSRMNPSNLKLALKRTTGVILFISLLLFLGLFLFAKPIIIILYGVEYLPAVSILRILAILLLTMPLVANYSSYFIAKGRPGYVTKILLVITIISIALNYLFISYFIRFGAEQAIYGSCVATLITSIIYISGLLLQIKKI
jgi:O-antigen/teichoic acid export membrane protein